MGLFDGINNPFKSKHGLGTRVADQGILSRFRWYDPLLLAGNPLIGSQIIAGRELGGDKVFEDLYGDLELPELEEPERPERPPDLTDMALKAASKAQRDSILTKRGRRSTFLTGQSASSTYLG